MFFFMDTRKKSFMNQRLLLEFPIEIRDESPLLCLIFYNFYFVIINDGVSWEYFHDLYHFKTNEKNEKSR